MILGAMCVGMWRRVRRIFLEDALLQLLYGIALDEMVIVVF